MPGAVVRREHAGGAAPAVLTGAISSSDTAISLSTAVGWPTGSVGPFFVVLDPGTASEEKVLCASQAAAVLTVAGGGRGADGTTAKSHAINAPCYPCWAAAEADELNEHANATAQVHGLAAGSAVVGRTDTQTLTNKTMSGASNTFSAIPIGAVPGAQPLDATVTALAGLSAGAGFVVESAADVFVKRSLASGDAILLPLTNPAGTAGDPSYGYLGPRGAVARVAVNTSSDIGATETITHSVTFTALADRCYRVSVTTPMVDNQGTGAATGIVTLRYAAGASVTNAGTLIAKATVNVNSTTTSTTPGDAAVTTTLVGHINDAAAGQTTVGIGLTRAGTTNVRFLAGTTIGPDFTPYLLVEDIGIAL